MWHFFQPVFQKQTKGFTLGELLISLAVLGLIAGLTIPSLWLRVKSSQDKALFLSTVKILTEASTKITNEPPALVAPNNTTWHVFDPWLNSADDNFVAVSDVTNSFTLQGGAVISRFTGTVNDGRQAILIDVNGAVAPNQIGKDRLMVTACFDPTGTCAAVADVTVNSAVQESGTVGPTPDATGGAGNVAYYNTLTQTN